MSEGASAIAGLVVSAAFDEHATTLERCGADLREQVGRAVALLSTCFGGGNKTLVFGNGGSAADSQHLASELVGRFDSDRPGWPAFALTVDTSTLTSVSNDFGFDQVFARQVDAVADAGDCVVVFSTSGTSPNVLAGVQAARSAGCSVISLTGAAPTPLASFSDVHIAVPSTTVARVQEVHLLCLHAVVAALESYVAGSDDAGRP